MEIVWETIGLRTPRGRLIFFALVTLAVFIAPISALSHLSLWQALHIPAPSIGLTRAYHYLLHGDVTAAYHRNRLIFLVLMVGLPILLKDLYNVFINVKRGN